MNAEMDIIERARAMQEAVNDLGAGKPTGYPTPQQFVEALAAHRNIDRASIRITAYLGAELGFDTAIQQNAVLTVTSEHRTDEEGRVFEVTDIGLTLDGRIVRVWFPDDAPHWAAAAIAAIRDGWPA